MEVPFNNTIVSDNEFIASLEVAELEEEDMPHYWEQFVKLGFGKFQEVVFNEK